MIELPRSLAANALPRLKVFGIGSAGCNMLDRLVLDGMTGAELIAVNTDVQALTGCVAPQQIHIGQNVTHGLGTGGDPDLGAAAADESLSELTSGLREGDLVFLLGGLGGGTASGVIPALAAAARENGAHVVVIATLPFAFEGQRRQVQADDSLASLRETADLLICFENDRMGEIVSARAGIQDAFVAVDVLLSQCLRSLGALTQRRGLLHAGFAELATVFHQADLRALFGAGEGAGDNRANEAAEALLKSPLLHRGRHLREIEAAILHIAGGPDLTYCEIQTALEEVRRHLPADAQTFLTVAVDPELAGRLSMTLLGALPVTVEDAVPAALALKTRPLPASRPAAARPPRPEPEPELFEGETPEAEPLEELVSGVTEHFEEMEVTDEGAETEEEAEPSEEQLAPVAPVRPAGRPVFSPMSARPAPTGMRRFAPEPEPATQPAKPREVKQEQMLFEPVNRGRFEKSEPTIIDGQDLDIPTFLRRNLRLK